MFLFNTRGGVWKVVFLATTWPLPFILDPPSNTTNNHDPPPKVVFPALALTHILANVHPPHPSSNATPPLPHIPSAYHFLPMAPCLHPPIMSHHVNDCYANFVATPSRCWVNAAPRQLFIRRSRSRYETINPHLFHLSQPFLTFLLLHCLWSLFSFLSTTPHRRIPS